MSPTHAVSQEELMRYLDRELPADRHAEVDAHLRECTECHRELVVFEYISAELSREVDARLPGASIWDGVNEQIARPVGWVLFLAGLVMWAAWAAYSWILSPDVVWVKLAEGAIFIGFALLLGSVLREHYVAWRSDPYRHVRR